MTSSGSLKDVVKAIASFCQEPSLPLPDDLTAIISSFIKKHEASGGEDVAERLSEDMLSVYQKSIHDQPARYAPFLVVMRSLRPVLKLHAGVLHLWDVMLDPTLEYIGQERGLANEMLSNITSVVSLVDGGADAASEAKLKGFIDRVMGKWMEIMDTANQPPGMTSDDDVKGRLVQKLLLHLAGRDPQSFMGSLNGYVAKKECRNRAFNLLGHFIQSEPARLHLAVQTPLFANILQSLQKDTSTMTVTLALLVLILLMPHMPSSLAPFLPSLFNIYARLLFWDIDRSFELETTETEGLGKEGEESWEKSLFDPDQDGNSIPYLQQYFTILYGLYPINFVDYIRKPQRYLRHANMEEDIDVQAMEVRDRSEQFRQHHLLHPNFYNLTIETEKTDLSRFIQNESSEVLADCFALLIVHDRAGAEGAQEEAPAALPRAASPSLSEETSREGYGRPLLSASLAGDGSSSRNSLSVHGSHTGPATHDLQTRRSSHSLAEEYAGSRAPRDGNGSPSLAPGPARSTSHSQLQDLIHSNRAIKSGLYQSLANDSVPSLALSHQESIPEKGPGQRPASQQAQEASPSSDQEANGPPPSPLYQQSLLLQNDLQFERYIKQQHMKHIGELRRKEVGKATTEAETQNLVMGNRHLRHRLEEAKKSEVQIKKEFDQRRNMGNKREADLTSKLKTLREEQKAWVQEGDALRRTLGSAQADCERLQKVADEAEEKRLKAEQNLEAIDIGTDEIEKLRNEVTKISASLREYQGKESKMQEAIDEAAAAQSRVEQISLALTARDEQLLQMRDGYESQIAELHARLSEALENRQAPQTPEVKTVYESALAISRAKSSELQKQLNALTKKHTALESSLLDMQCEALRTRRNAREAASTTDTDLDTPASAGAPPISIAHKLRSRRSLADLDAISASSQNTAPSPLEAMSSSYGSLSQRPSTPSGSGTSDPLNSSKGSPQGDRYFGRGGVQNTSRKERKEKKDDKQDKKEKKSGGVSGGLRGIRGFV